MNGDAPLPIGRHLAELRVLVLRALMAVGTAAVVAFAVAPAVFRFLERPYRALLAQSSSGSALPFLQTLEPAETFKMSFTISLVVGTMVVLPYLFFELWRFIRPGLQNTERRWVFPIMAGGTLLFFLGAAFAYYVVMPVMLAFFWDYSLRLGVTPAWAIGRYINFVLGILVSFGLAFELPVVVSILAGLGIVTAAWMKKTRRYAIFGICVLSAVLTPADALSMILMAVPLVGLYELSIVLARMIGEKDETLSLRGTK